MLIFKNNIPEGRFFPVYNDHTVSVQSIYGSLVGEDKISMRLLIAGEEVCEVIKTADPEGRTHFNITKTARAYLNKNNFADDLSLEFEQGNFLLRDSSASEAVTVKYSTEIENADETFQYLLLRAVEQPTDVRRGITFQDKRFSILSPYTDKTAGTFHAVYFEGYPFDISFLCCEDESALNLRNKSLNTEMSFGFDSGVYRLFLSDGYTDLSLLEELPLRTGVNELQFAFGDNEGMNQEEITLYLDKRPADCGVYLQWMNNLGGWSYWLFQSLEEENKYKDKGILAHQTNLSGGSFFTERGKEPQEIITVGYKGASDKELAIIESIGGSPRVYMYVKERFSHNQRKERLEVRVTTGSFKKKTENRRHDVKFKISVPKEFMYLI